MTRSAAPSAIDADGGASSTVIPGAAGLFCPADRPERWSKALERADWIVLDLEDAVAPAGRPAARDAIRRHGAVLDRAIVRINPTKTQDHHRDLTVLQHVPYPVVMLAKAEDPAAVRDIPHRVIVLIETATGVEHVEELLDQPNVVGAMWGADDLVVSMGGFSSRRSDRTWRDIAGFVRHRVLIAAKARGLLALDAVHLDINDLQGLRQEAEDAAAIGFDATAAIHPGQIPTIRSAYRPSEAQVRWATTVVHAVRDHPGAAAVDGQMVDAPVLRAARTILDRASAALA